MNAERLLKHFHRIGEVPNAIPDLRRFILALAVRGKLVPQDPSDEPSSMVLERRKIAFAVEGPFGLPPSWVWAEVGELATARLGKMLDKAKNKGTPRRYLRNINVRWFDFDLSDLLEMRFEDSELPEFALRSGDVLICEGGEPGRAAVWDEREGDIYFQKAIHRVRFSSVVDSAYFVKALRASGDDGRLAEYFTGTGIKHFTGKGLDTYQFPLPPLAEQHRIVTKVNELTVLCDGLEAARAEREARRDRLSAASLARLNTPDPATFHDDARFALDALPVLTTRPDQIKYLRQTILNLAVRGHLVPQNPNDEPASELLKRIAVEKARLVEAGEIKRTQELPPPSDDEMPFALPSAWLWARFVEVAAIQSNLVDPRRYKSYPHIAPDNIERGTGQLLPYETIGDSGVFSSKHLFHAGCLLYSKIRPALAKVILADFEGLCSADMYPLRPFVDRKYLLKFMLAEVFVRQSVIEDNRVAMPKINQESLSKILVAVPPLAEQHRIVAKVDELMALCDRLEASLAISDGTRRRLLDALLAEALAPRVKELEAAE